MPLYSISNYKKKCQGDFSLNVPGQKELALGELSYSDLLRTLQYMHLTEVVEFDHLAFFVDVANLSIGPVVLCAADLNVLILEPERIQTHKQQSPE